MLHVNLSVVVCVETRLNHRPNNHSTPHNRYGLPTLGGDSEALLQWQFDQHLHQRLIRTFTAGQGPVKTIFATEFTEGDRVSQFDQSQILSTDGHGLSRMAVDASGSHPCLSVKSVALK